ncbi:MAG: AI-2E family transporter [Clostridia bacterium]|nr:AI-2E family transporter [Clostridia bacterium]
MKKLIPSEMRSRTISNILVVAAGMGMLAVLMYFSSIWSVVTKIMNIIMPFIVGFGLAFLQLPIIKKVEWFLNRFLFRKKPHPKLSRAMGTTFSLLVLLAAVASFLGIMLPQLVDSVKQLVTNISAFITSNVDHLNKLLVQWNFISFEGEELVIAWEKILSETSNYIAFVVDNVLAIGSTIYTTLFQLFVGLITAFYLLMDKERFCAQAKKICYSLMRQDTCESLIYWTRRANHIFSGFIAGKILDSLIIGVLCYVGMLVFKMEYALLISVIVGVTNIIPFFGPFIGAIPSILILLIVNPISAAWFALFILALQQLDGNVIGPLILGDYVGISPLWIMISIVIGGGLFGFAGMLLSVPVFALCYAIVRACIESRLKERGLPIHSSHYTDAPERLDKNAEN